MKRRTFLRAAAGTTAAGLFAGCGGRKAGDVSAATDTETPASQSTETPSPTAVDEPVVPEEAFERTLDAVADLGMDPDGEEPIDGALEAALEPKTLIEFPPGQYLATKSHVLFEVDTFGMRGLGESRSDVEFVFPEGNEGSEDPGDYLMFNIRDGENVLLDNFTVQQTQDMVTGVGMVVALRDGLSITNVEWAGFNPAEEHDPGSCLRVRITETDGLGVIDGFHCRGGGVIKKYPARKGGIYLGSAHRGEIRLLNSDIRNMGSSAMYFTQHRGCARIENCYFENNDNTNIRIDGGSHPEKQSWVKNCQVFLDTENAARVPEGEQYLKTRAILCESGGENRSFGGNNGVLFDDVDVHVQSMPVNSTAAAIVAVRDNHGSATFRHLQVFTRADGVAPFVAEQADERLAKEPYDLTLEDVNVVGPADVEHAITVTGRDESVVRDSYLHLYDHDQNGIHLQECNGCEISDTLVNVPGEPVVLTRSNPTSVDVQTGGE